MKKLITLLAIITLLSCEKEEELNPIFGELTVLVSNTIESGITPLGFIVEYYLNDELIKDEFDYVGNNYKIWYESDKPLRFKAYNNGYDIQVIIYYEDKPILKRNGYQEININEILYNEPINL